MITKIEVDGFKSLRKFELKLKKGLNILVGPNGAGKTNIILYFEFLSKLATNEIGTAISLVGGAGSIFQKIGQTDYIETIKSKIYGCYQLKSKSFVIYELSFEIKISFQKDLVYYSSQEIKIKKTTTFGYYPDNFKQPIRWDMHLAFNSADGLRQKINFLKYNPDKFKSEYGAHYYSSEKNFKKYIENRNLIFGSLITFIYPIIDIATTILTDLIGGETFNLVPSKIRELEDSATPPGIRKDGSGLATTLYAMKKGKTIKPNRDYPSRFYRFNPIQYFDPGTLEKVIGFLKLANSSIYDLQVDNDPFNNKLNIRVHIKTGEYDAVLPLSAMSDGTIKWLTLITAILSSKTIFSIEEPENFLHPWMQGEIADIMRNHISEKKNHSFVIMTTHSESLLNFAKTDEIILVDLFSGSTIATRIKNQKVINDEISNSGFGLGHFYFTNSLSND